MHNSKSPGPDGYTEFYKSFKEKISPLLLEVFNEAINRSSSTFYQASISLIHKIDKDPLDPASYRPVSLYNLDNKLQARMEMILQKIISQDQTGFIKNSFLM